MSVAVATYQPVNHHHYSLHPHPLHASSSSLRSTVSRAPSPTPAQMSDTYEPRDRGERYEGADERIVLPPPSALGERLEYTARPSLPSLVHSQPQSAHWERTPRSVGAMPDPSSAPLARVPSEGSRVQLPSILSISRSSSPAQTVLPTPGSIHHSAHSYFGRSDESRPTSTSSRFSPTSGMHRFDAPPSLPSRRVHPPLGPIQPLTHVHHAQGHMPPGRASPPPMVKYEPDVSPPLRSAGLPDQRYYAGGASHHRMYDVRGRSVSDAGARHAVAAAQEDGDFKEHNVGQTRRLAHLMSEQKRRESINTGFASLRAALPSAHPTDSKAVVLRKAVARIQQLEHLAGLAPPPSATSDSFPHHASARAHPHTPSHAHAPHAQHHGAPHPSHAHSGPLSGHFGPSHASHSRAPQAHEAEHESEHQGRRRAWTTSTSQRSPLSQPPHRGYQWDEHEHRSLPVSPHETRYEYASRVGLGSSATAGTGAYGHDQACRPGSGGKRSRDEWAEDDGYPATRSLSGSRDGRRVS